MINFIKDLLPVNPAYNDSIIQFNSNTITGATKAVITIEGDSFTTVPNAGVFTFNFKEIIKTKINTNRFEDEIVPNLLTEEYIYPDPNIGREFNIDIQVQNYTTGETISKTYYFQRSVEQLPNYHRLTALPNGIRLLLPTNNYIDYSVKYFEGYPFDFTVNGIRPYNTIYFNNITTNQQTDEYLNITEEAKRVFLSDGGTNTTNTDILVNSSTLNRIELYLNDSFKANINIMKVESQCGVYLKWLNSKGSYSYWLFDSIYKDNLTPRTIDEFAGYYDNLQNLTSTSHLIGKTANRILQINTKFDNADAEYLRDLAISPAVWMYAHQVPFQQVQDRFDWIGVKVSDTAFPVDRKTSKQKLNLTITLPDLQTITQ
jgi:hypothetical protein